MSTTESPKETAFQKVAACLDEQGSFLTKADIEGRFTCSYSQMVAYVSTELFRLVMCEERLIPTENKDLDKEIKSLIKMLRTRLYNIAKQMDFIPLDESLDPTMFCFPGGFIAPQAGTVGKLPEAHKERYRAWLIRQRDSGHRCHICDKMVLCLCSGEMKYGPKKRTCFLAKIYPCVNYFRDDYIHICSKVCDEKFNDATKEEGLKEVFIGQYSLKYNPEMMSEEEALKSLRDYIDK